MHLSRMTAALTTLLAAILVATGLTTGPAHASLLDITCPLGVQTTTFDPGLTYTTKATDFSVSGSLGTCVSLTHPQIVGGDFTASGSGDISCLAGATAAAITITWNTGQTSTVVSQFNINLKPNGTTVLVQTGEVTSGLFAGSTAVMTRVLAGTDLTACLTPQGLAATSGAITTTIAL